MEITLNRVSVFLTSLNRSLDEFRWIESSVDEMIKGNEILFYKIAHNRRVYDMFFMNQGRLTVDYVSPVTKDINYNYENIVDKIEHHLTKEKGPQVYLAMWSKYKASPSNLDARRSPFIRGQFERKLHEMTNSYNEFLSNSNKYYGRMNFNAKITASGKVAGCEVGVNKRTNSELAEKMCDIVEKIKFPVDIDDVEISFPLVFSPKPDSELKNPLF